MLGFPSALKIYLAVEPVDMRKQFNGLWALAAETLREDPRQGALFVFTNKPRDRLCHRPLQNQPGLATSKPATLRMVWSWEIGDKGQDKIRSVWRNRLSFP